MNIAIIENLGVLDDIYESMDFTGNELAKVEGFPVLQRLDTLLLSNNQISKISPTLSESLPNLTALNLHNNKIANILELLPLRQMKELRMLNLSENPIVQKYLNWKLIILVFVPQLTFLNFESIPDELRIEAKKLSRKVKKGASLESFLVVDEGYLVMQRRIELGVQLQAEQWAQNALNNAQNDQNTQQNQQNTQNQESTTSTTTDQTPATTMGDEPTTTTTTTTTTPGTTIDSNSNPQPTMTDS